MSVRNEPPVVTLSSLPDISQAKLPALYVSAVTAISELSEVDECQQWANKAEAMASYAKHSKDDTLRKMADRIQARAIRRCGQLLQQIPRGDEATRFGQEGDHQPVITRTEAATAAGLSEHQRKTSLRVATIPAKEFEAAVESAEPPTVTKLAEVGRKAVPKAVRPTTSKKTREANKAARRQQKMKRFIGQVADTPKVLGILADRFVETALDLLEAAFTDHEVVLMESSLAKLTARVSLLIENRQKAVNE